MVILRISMSSEWRRDKIKVKTRSSNSSASPLKLFNLNPNLFNAAAGKNFDDSTVSKSPRRGYKIGIPVLIFSPVWRTTDG
jgi:hypothetical protein